MYLSLAMQHTLRSHSLAVQPTLDPLPNQPTRFSHPSSVEAPGPHNLKNARRIRKAGVDAFTAVPMLPPPRCRCLHFGVDALTAVLARGTKIPSHSALKVLSVVLLNSPTQFLARTENRERGKNWLHDAELI